MVLLGSKAPARNVEQHDYFFGVARSLKELVPAMKTFWPEAGSSIHVDGWREVTRVGHYRIDIGDAAETHPDNPKRLFFINLGGYQSGKLAEQHYTVLSVQSDRAQAVQEAKRTVFFKTNSIRGANAHIDEKYGIDVDDIYRIEDVLSAADKSRFRVLISEETEEHREDPVHLGYYKLDKIPGH